MCYFRCLGARYTLTRHYTQFSINDYIKDRKMFGIKEFIIKKVSQVNVFKNKIDLNQYLKILDQNS